MIGQMKTGAVVVRVADTGVYVVRCACGNHFTRSECTLKVYMRDPRARLRCSECYRSSQRAEAITNGTIARKGV